MWDYFELLRSRQDHWVGAPFGWVWLHLSRGSSKEQEEVLPHIRNGGPFATMRRTVTSSGSHVTREIPRVGLAWEGGLTSGGLSIRQGPSMADLSE